MCGVAGILNLDGEPVSAAHLRSMTDALAHRGPDGEGVYIDGPAGLGHRRLAIIDLSSAAHQPMVSRDGRYVLSYNGEIYNFQTLRAELIDLGHSFRSRSDTEVLLEAWAHWGKSCVNRLNGMFGFGIWDRQERALYLARDRYGIKPLYYACWGQRCFVFASEQKALLTHPFARRKLDREALLEYFTFQNFFTDRTLLLDVKLLPPASIARIGVEEQSLKLERYWDFCFEDPPAPADRREYQEELDRLIHQAVQRQLVTDVELGSYLSGGLDSGTLTALAAKALPYIKTFTCGFDLSSASGIELTFDEREKAEAMSAVFRTEHYELILKAGDMERCLPAFAHHLEEPRVGQSYPNFYVARLASRFVKVVLSGVGGDELFGGYPWRYFRASGASGFEDYIDRYYVFWQRLVPNSAIARVFKPIWADVKDVWTRDIFRDVFLSHRNQLESPQDYINHSLYFEAKTFLHGLLIVEDKLSMAHGLESRVPFLDNDLVDFAMRCPISFKLNNLSEVIRMNENEPGNKISRFFERTRDGKQILRETMSRYIPDNVTHAVKQGFSSPDASWFRGESIELVRRKLITGTSPLWGYLDRESVTGLIEEHLSGQSNRRLLIWSLLNVDEYLHQLGL